MQGIDDLFAVAVIIPGYRKTEVARPACCPGPPTPFIEIFSLRSWEEHLRQHSGCLTATDRDVEEAALGFSDPPAQYLLSRSVVPSCRSVSEERVSALLEGRKSRSERCPTVEGDAR